jgi:hypothetical protein
MRRVPPAPNVADALAALTAPARFVAPPAGAALSGRPVVAQDEPSDRAVAVARIMREAERAAATMPRPSTPAIDRERLRRSAASLAGVARDAGRMVDLGVLDRSAAAQLVSALTLAVAALENLASSVDQTAS